MVRTTGKLADRIQAELTRQDSNKLQLSENTGISRTTLNRKLADTDLLTLKELTKIATALGINPSELGALHFEQAQP